MEMSINDDYKTHNLVDFSFDQNYYKFIGIVLTNQDKHIQIFFNKLILQEH